MRMVVLQHVPFEGPAAIADWALARGVSVTVSYLYKNEPLPPLGSFDMLTVMGGPMSANDEATLDWLTPEIALVHEAMTANKFVVGICLERKSSRKLLERGFMWVLKRKSDGFPCR